LADSAIVVMGDPSPELGRSVAGVDRVSLNLPFLPQLVRLVAVKLVPSSDVTVRPHRWRRTVTRPSSAAAHDGEPLPLQPKPSYLHKSKRRVTGNAWVGSVSRASSPPTSLSSPELSDRRSPISLPLTRGALLSAPRVRAGVRDGPRAGWAALASRAGPAL
jgi:hypothetical protein